MKFKILLGCKVSAAWFTNEQILYFFIPKYDPFLTVKGKITKYLKSPLKFTHDIWNTLRIKRKDDLINCEDVVVNRELILISECYRYWQEYCCDKVFYNHIF